MKIIEEELERVRADINRLKIEEAALMKVLNKFRGIPAEKPARSRSPSVKPMVLQLMADAGPNGATSAEVDELVRAAIPTVAKDTVGSILSRLKSDGALVYAGERYYEKRFAPPTDEGPSRLRAVT